MLRSLKLTSRAIHAAPIGITLAMLAAGAASAQERCKMSSDLPAADAKFTQRLVLDVGDVPGHNIRLIELHKVFTNDTPNCEGLKRVEEWDRLFADYAEGLNGRAWGYFVTTLENGDKIFGEFSETGKTVVAKDGTKETTFEGTGRWTGGTGKYLGVRGLEWDHTIAEPSKGLNQIRSEAEYWFDK